MTNHRKLALSNQALQRLTGGWAVFNCGRTRVNKSGITFARTEAEFSKLFFEPKIWFLR
jgi:hypothetical protein